MNTAPIPEDVIKEIINSVAPLIHLYDEEIKAMLIKQTWYSIETLSLGLQRYVRQRFQWHFDDYMVKLKNHPKYKPYFKYQ